MRQKKAKRLARENAPDVRPGASHPLFPGGWIYFTRWRSLRGFLLLLIPVLLSAADAFWRHRISAGCGVCLFGVVTAGLLFVTVASNTASSNWGTFRRGQEPVRYWIGVYILIIFYSGVCAAGWFVNR